MHNKIFPGVDVAGNSLKGLTLPGERVFLFTHSQGLGIARYAQRYMGRPINFKDFIAREQEFNIRYLCFYPAAQLPMLEKKSPDLFSYIQDNYHIKEMGLIKVSNSLVYLILQKGKGGKLTDTLHSFSGKVSAVETYNIPAGKILFFPLRGKD